MHNELLIKEIKSELNKSFGFIINKVILFGSRIDQTAHKNSDYDVLIILEKKIDWQTRDKVLDVITDFNIKHDLLVDVHFISKSELQTIKGKQPYIQNALATGMAV